MLKKKIAVGTTSRADNSRLYWPFRELRAHPALELKLIAHLSPEFGTTVAEIAADGFEIEAKLECLLSSDSDVGMANLLAAVEKL